MPISLQELLSQLQALVPEDAPWAANDEGQRGNFRCERCVLCNDCRFCQDCQQCRECTYCEHCEQCEGCTQCRRCLQCHDASYLEDCRACARSSYLILCLDCEDCVHCLGCVGLRSAEFCILNQQVERQAYFEQLRALRAEIETKVRSGWRIAELEGAARGFVKDETAREACGSEEETAREACGSEEQAKEAAREAEETAREACGSEEETAREACGSEEQAKETAREESRTAAAPARAEEEETAREACGSGEETEETAREACGSEEQAKETAREESRTAAAPARAEEEETARETAREACGSEEQAKETAREACSSKQDKPSPEASGEEEQLRGEPIQAQARDLLPASQEEFEARLAHLNAPRSPKARVKSEQRASLWQRRLANRASDRPQKEDPISTTSSQSRGPLEEASAATRQGWNRGLAARPLPSPRGPARWRGSRSEEQPLRQDGSPSAWLPRDLSSQERSTRDGLPSEKKAAKHGERERRLQAQAMREQSLPEREARAPELDDPARRPAENASPNRLLAFVKSGAARATSEEKADQKHWARAKLPRRKS